MSTSAVQCLLFRFFSTAKSMREALCTFFGKLIGGVLFLYAPEMQGSALGRCLLATVLDENVIL